MLADLAGSDPASWRRPGSWRKRTPAVTVVVRRPGGPLAGLVTSLTYRTGEQPRTSVEKILPSPETGLWVNLNRDAFRSFGWSGGVRQVPGTMVSRSEEHTSELQSHVNLVCRLLLEKKKIQ